MVSANSRTTAPLRYYIYDAIGPRDVNDNDDDERGEARIARETLSLETPTMGIPCRTDFTFLRNVPRHRGVLCYYLRNRLQLVRFEIVAVEMAKYSIAASDECHCFSSGNIPSKPARRYTFRCTIFPVTLRFPVMNICDSFDDTAIIEGGGPGRGFSDNSTKQRKKAREGAREK